MQTKLDKAISIVATCYSQERFRDVIDLIESICCQTYRSLNLILVIEKSRDLYQEISSYIAANSISNVTVVFSSLFGLSSARNLGVKLAKGDIIAFVDDDVILEPQWAEETAKMFDDPVIIGTAGPCRPLIMNGKQNRLSEELEWLIGCTAFYGLKQPVEIRNAWGMNMAFRRELFECGLRFNEAFGMRSAATEAWGQRPPEDVDFSLRARAMTGGHILYNPYAGALHKVYQNRFQITNFIKKSFFMGRQRRIMKITYTGFEKGLLEVEKSLLRRILFRTFPRALMNFPKSPRTALYQFAVALMVLMFVFLGYVLCRSDRVYYAASLLTPFQGF